MSNIIDGETGETEIIEAPGGVACEYCGHGFAAGDVPTTVIPSTTLYRCPACERWSEDR